MSISDIGVIEPWYAVVTAGISWVIVLGVWLFAPDYILIPLVIAVLLTLLAILLYMIEPESGSTTKIDKPTGKHRCRVCHQYFPRDQLLDKTCPDCRQTLRS
ncbi:MAG: hypothetical protein ACXAB4_04675 [Candidatus Hodarchaeales archaeon]